MYKVWELISVNTSGISDHVQFSIGVLLVQLTQRWLLIFCSCQLPQYQAIIYTCCNPDTWQCNAIHCQNLPSFRLRGQQFNIWLRVCLTPHLHLSLETLPHIFRFTLVGRVSKVEFKMNFIVPLGRLYITLFQVASVPSIFESSRYFPFFTNCLIWLTMVSFSWIFTNNLVSILTSETHFTGGAIISPPPDRVKTCSSKLIIWLSGVVCGISPCT